MSESPATQAHGPVDATIKSGGRAVAAGSLESLTVVTALNKIPFARLVFLDGDTSEQNFPLSDGGDFKPGTDVEVEAGYDGTTKTLFKGVVVRHRLKLGAAGAMLHVECRDPAYAMTLDRKNASFIGKTDSDVMKAIVGQHSGISASVTATTVKYDEIVQYYCSDWDFVLTRAEVNGHVVTVDDGKIDVAPPASSAAAVLEVTHGTDIIDFSADIDARTQLESVESVGWDPATQKVASGEARPDDVTKQGNLNGTALAGAAGARKFRQQSGAALPADALTSWSKARQLKSGLARIQGSVSFPGHDAARAGKVITLKGVGERFDGDVYLTQVRHTIRAGEWVTEADFGQPPVWFTERPDVTAPPASGWTPAIGGVHIGVVRKLDEDPGLQFRVQVSIPILGEDAEPVWARVSRWYSSDKFGAFFIPEIDDEVVLGFLNDDPSHPVILGSLYSSKRPPPYDMAAENNIKALVTRSKMKIEFEDEKKILTLATPEGNTLMLDEDEKKVTLEDQNGNSVVLEDSGITMTSPKDITVSAGKNVSIKATGNVAVEAQQDVTVDGLNITHSASVGLTAKGGASAEVSASGQTTVKGAMVMIN